MTSHVASGPLRTAWPWLTTVARISLAVVLGWAGLAKISSPALSVIAVQGYELLPRAAETIVGYGLPFLELALAALLLAGLGVRMAGAVSAALFLLFIAGIASAWARGLSIDCGCFGGGGQVDPADTRYGREILRDVGFLVLAIWIAAGPRSRLALDGRLGDERRLLAPSAQDPSTRGPSPPGAQEGAR